MHKITSPKNVIKVFLSLLTENAANGPTNDYILLKSWSKVFTHPRKTCQIKNFTSLGILILQKGWKNRLTKKKGIHQTIKIRFTRETINRVKILDMQIPSPTPKINLPQQQRERERERENVHHLPISHRVIELEIKGIQASRKNQEIKNKMIFKRG